MAREPNLLQQIIRKIELLSMYDDDDDLIQQPYGASTRVNFKLQLISIFFSSFFFLSFFE
jgi:hypothetical protein